MSLIRLPRNIISRSIVQKRFLSTVPERDEEYTAVPHYPEILDISHESKLKRKKQAWCDEIQAVKTVEEKQIKLNMPRYYGFKCYLFQENVIPYDNLKLAQHITRTHLIETNTLPDYYKNVNVDGVLEKVKARLEEALLLEYEGYKRTHDLKKDDLTPSELENKIAGCLANQVNRVICATMAEEYKYLIDLQVDSKPRIESFWFAGGMFPPERIKSSRRNIEWQKHKENEPTDRAIQYSGTPILTLRTDIPLKPIISFTEATNSDFEIPYFKYDPRTVGTKTNHQHAVNVPGFWPGDSHQFSLLSYHDRGHLLERTFDDMYVPESLHRQGILASFGWLNSLANFLGFTTFNDITYPLVTQTVITNGKEWSFYTYQLNTMIIHGVNPNDNPKRNVCWALPQMKLFESIKDGKVVGLNDDVLTMLLKYYGNAPEERLGVNLTPYLSQEGKYISHYEDDDKRAWLEREYKFLVSNRPRYKLDYEIYHWEKIYKIDHKTRAMEARRRPFELFNQPFDRTLDNRQAFYIPRKLRPDLPHYKGRYAKEYFP